MDPLDKADWSFPIPIHYGPGRIAELGEVCKRYGIGRPLLVTDRGSRNLPFIGQISRSLAEARLGVGIYADLSPNPVDSEILAGKRVFNQGGHDGVLAVGGGSGMDGGKAISLIAGRGEPLWDFDFDVPVKEVDTGFVPLICVPTTAGTGAETDSTAMVTDTSRGIKGCVWHPLQKPRAAILDPVLTQGLPSKLTAWTGCDALVHAIEAFSVDAWHPMCDGIALESMRLIGRWLRLAVKEPNNLRARGGMLVGSCLAGVAFLKGLGLVHAISHMVGAGFDTHHGLTNAIVLPVVLRFNEPAIADKVPEICAALGVRGRSFDAFHAEICSLLDGLGVPVRLSDIGVSPNSCADLAMKASKDPAALTNPRRASLKEIEDLIHEAVTCAR
ncbi:MAG: iron-containing alcohol dehydrogenase [Pirellulaceae bacterium]